MTFHKKAAGAAPGRGPAAAMILLFLTFSLIVVTIPAGAEEEAWQPPPPMPDEFDWIQLVSGEWLKGEIIAMYDGSLEFDSDKMGLQSFDWGDITQLRSARVVQVLFTDDTTATGRLFLEDGKVRLIAADEKVTAEEAAEEAVEEEGPPAAEMAAHDSSEVLTIVAGKPRERNFWTGKLALGANVRDGNTDQVEASAQATFKRRTIKNRLVFDYLGVYNETENVESANNHRASAVWHRFLSQRLFLMPLFGEYFRDPFQNIAHRGTIGTGLGYQLIDTARTDWEVSGGPAYQNTRFDEVEEGTSDSESTPALRIATNLNLELSSRVDFDYSYSFQLTNEESGTYNHHMVTGLVTELTGRLNFDVSLVWDRIQDPRPDADGIVPEQDDFKLILGLGIDF